MLVATWNDIESDLFDKYKDECGNYMAFATTDKVIVKNASDSENSSDDEVPKKLTFQEAYDKLCPESIKSEKTSHLCRKELNEVKTEKAESLVMENTSLEEKVKNLVVELSQARIQIERMFSAKLDEVLSAQKPNSDKIGLGYVAFSDPFSSMASGSRTVFVP